MVYFVEASYMTVTVFELEWEYVDGGNIQVHGAVPSFLGIQALIG